MKPSNRIRCMRLLLAEAFLLAFAASCDAGNTPPAWENGAPAGTEISATDAVAAAQVKPANTVNTPTATRDPAAADPNYVVRGNLERSREKFTQAKTGRVAFLGGSVTNLAWREMVMRYLLKKFPGTEFDFINAGLNGTPAELGAFRLEEDVFARGPVDLLFLEFAVNGGSPEAMEGIVRHARALSPGIDIIQMHIAAKWFSDSLADGNIPGAVADHERVAGHYGNSSLHLYKEIYDRMKEAAFNWAEFAPDGVHPTEFGSGVYADFITNFLEVTWSLPDAKAAPASLPAPMTQDPWEHGSLVSCTKASSIRGFETIEDWIPERNGNLKGPVSFLAASAPGAQINFVFRGTIVGLYSVVGPDSAAVEYRIDDLEWKPLDTARDSWYPNDWYRLNGFVLETALADSAHSITFRTTENPGRVFRLFRLMVG
jgi:sialidase-1